MATYSIKDIEKLSGIKAHTLRIWEKRYNLLEPKRTETNIRFYDDFDLKKILNVALLNRNGHRISQIACLDNEQIAKKISVLAKTDGKQESRIDNLIISTIEMDENKFEKVLNTTIMQAGFEDTVSSILFPFFQKIGILWQTGTINPAQEHFISNLVRQKILVAIDGIVEKRNADSHHFILFLPEGELHELALLFYYYLLKRKGHKVTYLGQTVPIEDLHKAGELLHPDCLLTSIYSSFCGEKLREYLEKLRELFPKQKIFFSSSDQQALKFENRENFYLVKNNSHFIELLENNQI